jgi:hypothetical protein
MGALQVQTGQAAERAVRSAMTTLEQALGNAGGTIPPAAETQLQYAIDLLRRCDGGQDALARLEQIAIDLRVAVNARIAGRTNLHASRLARLRRTLAR